MVGTYKRLYRRRYVAASLVRAVVGLGLAAAFAAGLANAAGPGVINVYDIGLPGYNPYGIAAGADGNLWFSAGSPGGNGRIGQITPRGTVTVFSTGLSSSSSPDAIGAGSDGNIWFTDRTTSAIGRITLSGTISEFPTAGIQPDGLAAGSDGNIWFTGGRRIGKMTLAGKITQFSAGLAQYNTPEGIAVGPDGNMWFIDNGPSAIGKITPDGKITELNPLSYGFSQPIAIAPGPDGNVWLTGFGGTPATAAIARLRLTAPAASVTPPAVIGAGKQGTKQLCKKGHWSTWAGRQPSLHAYAFDGYHWLLNGKVIAGQMTRSYTPIRADVGHRLSCTETVTYTLFPTTVSATSAPVTVLPPRH